MTERIRAHQTRRGAGWRTVEAPLDAPAAVNREARPGEAILLDCLTLWLSNEIMQRKTFDSELLASALAAQLGEAVRVAAGVGCPVVAVSNEVGLGLVPETPLGRRFRDAQGRLNQRVAASAEYVAFIAAGLPLLLKGESPI